MHNVYTLQAAEDKLGGLDVLVLNHVYDVPTLKWTGSAENLTMFEKALDVNTRSYVHLTSHALPLLEQSAGSIVVLSSGMGEMLLVSPYQGRV